jgi:hypothetical protein
MGPLAQSAFAEEAERAAIPAGFLQGVARSRFFHSAILA